MSDDQQFTWTQPGFLPEQPSSGSNTAQSASGQVPGYQTGQAGQPGDAGQAGAGYQQAGIHWQQPVANNQQSGFGNQQPGGYQQPSWGMPGMSWAPAPQPGIIPLRPLRFSELFEGSFKAVRANPPVMFGFSLAVMAVVAVLGAIVQSVLYPLFDGTVNDPQAALNQADEITYMASSLAAALTSAVLPSILTAIGTIFIVGILALSVSDAVLGKVTTLREAWKRFKPRFWALLGLTILQNIIAIVVLLLGMLIFSLPLIITSSSGSEPGAASILLMIFGVAAAFVAYFAISIKLVFSANAVVLENASPIKAIKRSWRLTKGAFWQTLGRYITITILTSAASGVIVGTLSMVTVALSLMLSEAIAMAASTVLAGLASALILPITSAWTTLMYIDRRMTVENLGPVLQSAALQ